MTQPTAAADGRPPGRRVILLDNDPAVLDLLVLDLRFEGHEILAAVTTREAALAACASLDPEVVIVDLRLGPGADGIDVAGEILAATVPPRTRPVIAVYTNYVNSEVVARATRLGVAVVEKGNLHALRRAVTDRPAAYDASAVIGNSTS